MRGTRWVINPLTQSAVLFTCPKKQLIDFSHPCKHCISMVMASIPYLQWVDGAREKHGTGLLILLALLWLYQPSSWRKQIRVNTMILAYRANALKTQMALGPQTKICSSRFLLPPSQQTRRLLFRCTIYCFYHHPQQFPGLVPHVAGCFLLLVTSRNAWTLCSSESTWILMQKHHQRVAAGVRVHVNGRTQREACSFLRYWYFFRAIRKIWVTSFLRILLVIIIYTTVLLRA